MRVIFCHVSKSWDSDAFRIRRIWCSAPIAMAPPILIKKKMLYLRSGITHYGLAILRPYIYNIGQKQIFVVFVALVAGPSGN
jgi:hypothetical protein